MPRFLASLPRTIYYGHVTLPQEIPGNSRRIIVFGSLFVFAKSLSSSHVHDSKFGWLIRTSPNCDALCDIISSGEVANLYTFKYVCQARGDKLQKTVSCMPLCARWSVNVVSKSRRYSHCCNLFQSVPCGTGIYAFMLTAVLSLPKQFVTVHIGVGVMLESDANSSGAFTSRIIGDVVAITLLVAVVAMWYTNKAVSKVKPKVMQERRKSRLPPGRMQAKVVTQ
ncbi:hypothetical protein DFJ58DRAFT_838705 [Suillus subalutaceus]|uniref:uncharacterized protein n=1 Tax=Suillus subalutaceus TaxID=48586 RepID=UPI001B86FEB1|nr:uncharacterized protein DFJ58DRAFT_838705 [Suillus subalutaceus]KAG1864962.1 hypothetical protein DFJ58DRAFT_838705 [Suillus subalutaceus]